jgi:hypothetical protein
VQLADTVMFTIGETWHISMTTFLEPQHTSLTMASLLSPVQTRRDTCSHTPTALQPMVLGSIVVRLVHCQWNSRARHLLSSPFLLLSCETHV